MEKIRIALGCDHIGFALKEELKEYLINEKNAEIVLDPIKVPEDGICDFTITTDAICRAIQERPVQTRLFNLWNRTWLLLGG